MTRDEVLERLCKLQADVWQALDPEGSGAADCLCMTSGFWYLDSYRNNPRNYRNDGEALDFIESAVRKALQERGK